MFIIKEVWGGAFYGECSCPPEQFDSMTMQITPPTASVLAPQNSLTTWPCRLPLLRRVFLHPRTVWQHDHADYPSYGECSCTPEQFDNMTMQITPPTASVLAPQNSLTTWPRRLPLHLGDAKWVKVRQFRPRIASNSYKRQLAPFKKRKLFTPKQTTTLNAGTSVMTEMLGQVSWP